MAILLFKRVVEGELLRIMQKTQLPVLRWDAVIVEEVIKPLIARYDYL